MRKFIFYSALVLSCPAFLHIHAARAQPDDVPEINVTGRRLTPSANEPIFARTMLGHETLQSTPALRLDDALRTVPGFGLFRRQSSRAAHPTTQGVTLRGLGASGAGRTLILLDGIPQNDPFGGWIDWGRLPTAAIDQAVLTKGGGAGPWGNAALAGVIRLSSRIPEPGHGWADFEAGQNETLQGSAGGSARLGEGVIFGSAHGHATAGSYLIRKDQRGPVDRRAANRGGGFAVGASFPLSDATTVTARASYAEDRLINGTDPAVSKSQISDASIGLVHERGSDAPALQAHIYARDQKFSAVFASVDDARTTATPALDQFSVPSEAVGANVILRVPVGQGLSFETGGDLRFATGKTQELFQNSAQGFLRLREAGGDQVLAGGFAELTWTPDESLTLTAGGRVDAWRQSDGFRRETLRADNSVARNDSFATSKGTVGNFRVGGRYAVNAAFSLRAIVYSGFRVPTLNELYRPFRVGNDITEANAALTPEKMTGGDLGFEWSPNKSMRATVSYFRARLEDSVVNITLRTTPGLDPDLGVFVPAGGVLRQRRNLDRIFAEGLEADFEADLSPRATLTVRYLLSESEVKRSPDQSALVGKRLAQIPRHQAVVGLAWDVAERWRVSAQLRGASRQFEDDLNERRLAGYIVADISANYEVNEGMTAYVSVENIFDRTIESGVSADGLVSIGPKRLATAGVRFAF